MPRTRVYPDNASRQAAYRMRKAQGIPPTTRRARSFDRGAALLRLHAHLRAGDISEATFRVGVEHVALADVTGRHDTSKAALAKFCSDAHRKMHDTQVGRANDALVAVGFMTMTEPQLTAHGWSTREYALTL